MIKLSGPAIDVGVDDDLGQGLDLFQGIAEGGGATGLQDLGWVASGGKDHGGRVAGDSQ